MNISKQDILNNFEAFKFSSVTDVEQYEKLLKEGFAVISEALAKVDQHFVDTKFEFGYVLDSKGQEKLIYMDEVGTPDSSRIWDGEAYRNGQIIENSKEGFRQALLNYFPDPDILLNKARMPERISLAKDNALPLDMLMDVSKTYQGIAEKIIGESLIVSDDPRKEILDLLSSKYGLIK